MVKSFGEKEIKSSLIMGWFPILDSENELWWRHKATGVEISHNEWADLKDPGWEKADSKAEAGWVETNEGNLYLATRDVTGNWWAVNGNTSPVKKNVIKRILPITPPKTGEKE